jgi:hypothetical protein
MLLRMRHYAPLRFHYYFRFYAATPDAISPPAAVATLRLRRDDARAQPQDRFATIRGDSAAKERGCHETCQRADAR